MFVSAILLSFCLEIRQGLACMCVIRKLQAGCLKNALLNSEIRFWQSCWVVLNHHTDEQLEIMR